MNILHVWDQAGVACIVARQQRKMGHSVRIMKRSGYDPFGISAFYGEPLSELDGKSFIKAVLKEAATYDVIHVHSLFKIVPELRSRYPAKPIVLHYHGSEVRKPAKKPAQQKAEKDCSAIICSTQDLASFVSREITHIANPVDTDHFMPTAAKGEGAFTFKTTGADTDRLAESLGKKGIVLHFDIVDRQASPIQYSDMPGMLARYLTYIDFKHVNGSLLQAPSKTALECLACGLQVLDFRLEYRKGLPAEHQPDHVARKVSAVYESC